MNYHTALIVGAGSGLSASLARAFAKCRHERCARRALDRQARRPGEGNQCEKLPL